MADQRLVFLVQDLEGDLAGKANFLAVAVLINVGLDVVPGDDHVLVGVGVDGRLPVVIGQAIPVAGQLAKDKVRMGEDDLAPVGIVGTPFAKGSRRAEM